MHHDLILNHNSKIYLKACVKTICSIKTLAKTPFSNETPLGAIITFRHFGVVNKVQTCNLFVNLPLGQTNISMN